MFWDLQINEASILMIPEATEKKYSKMVQDNGKEVKRKVLYVLQINLKENKAIALSENTPCIIPYLSL